MKLHPDFKEFLQLLNAHHVKYLLVGGYALAIHGYPRSTGDMDIWYQSEPDNIDRLLDVLRQFGFSSTGLTAKDLVEPEIVIQLGYPPVRIDLMNSITGVSFDEAFGRRILIHAGGVEISCISLDDLKRNKKATGRLLDLSDLEQLEGLS
jgi:hypothetical protein